MKIGIVSQSYYPKPGGVTEVVHYTARELRRLGHSVTIITTNYWSSDETYTGVKRIGRNMLVPVNGAWVNVTLAVRMREKLAKIFREEDFDIIQTHCPLVPTLPLVTLRAARSDQKIVGTFHAAAESNVAYAIFRRALNSRAERLDVRIAVSEPARQFASRYFPGQYEIVPNGIDCDRFNPAVQPLDALDGGSLKVLYVGRMDKRKGVPYLLRALPIAQKKLRRKIQLILVGEGRLRGIISPRPIFMHGAEIVPMGRVNPELLPRYYRSADIFCSPATGRESFGIVLLEAMASGVPVIATNIPGYRGVISHEREGLLVRPSDPEALAEALVTLGSSPLLRKEFGARGREKALQYDWPIIVKRLEEIFRQTLGEEQCRQRCTAAHRNTG
jgi:phosphatidylinositol alpha-mannosyltransferase